MTKELVAALNPKRNEWEEIKAGLDKIEVSKRTLIRSRQEIFE